jgi:hypothetical protein
LKALLRQGARPHTIVLMLTPRQLVGDELRGDFSSHYLVRPADLHELAAELGWSATALTGSYVAAGSEFWAERAELRNFVLSVLVPKMDRLVNVFTSSPVIVPLVADRVSPVAHRRLERLRSMLDAHQIRFVIAIPAMVPRAGDTGVAGVTRAARAMGVALVEPPSSDSIGPREFRDGFHLSEHGASLYTAFLTRELPRALAGGAEVTARRGTR